MKRKEREGNVTSNHFVQLPDDLAVEILSRLPGTSLMNFQYVSKFCFSIIRNQRLTYSFISSSLKRGSRLLIAFNNHEFTVKEADMRLFLFTASNEGVNKSCSSSLVANLDMTIPSTVDYCYTQGSGTLAHGFLCCSYQGRFLICNPTTRQIVTLPESGDDVKKFTFKFLGYDPIDDQYKAMCILVSRRKPDDVEHKVLTLGGGDNKTLSWRQIEVNTRPYVPSTKGICINGIVYYGATRPDTDRVIACFDVRLEKISFMNLPFNIQSWVVGTNLIKYRGKLAVIHTISFGTSDGFTLWILEDVEKHEWSKKTYRSPLSWLNPMEIDSYSYIGINKAGEIILAPKLMPRNLETFYIFYFDLTSQGTRSVKLEGIADDEEFKRHYGIGTH